MQLALADLARATDPLEIRAVLSVVSLGRGALRLGALLIDIDESEIEAELGERQAWSDRYDETRRLPLADSDGL